MASLRLEFHFRTSHNSLVTANKWKPKYTSDVAITPLLTSHKTFQNSNIYISNKMHMLQSLFYLTTALHVSGVTIAHLQEHKSTVTTASGNRYTVLLSAAIVEELELV